MKNNSFLLNLSFALVFFIMGYTSISHAAGNNVPPVLPNATLPLIPAKQALPSLVTPPPPALKGKAWILIDAYSGKTLADKDADTPLPPASLTKMMTAYIVSSALQQGRLHLDDKVYISEKAWRMGGSKMFVKVGDYVPVRDLLQGIIVDSGNDACIAVAEHLAGSEAAFVELMNQQAKLLGMNHTHFTDSTGMPNSDHYSSPRDMATLARAIIFNFPEEYKTYSQKWFTYNNIKQPNRNQLLWRDSDVDGIKTGHTDDAGYCLAASAKKNNMRLVSIVMGAPTEKMRTNDSQNLLSYGFRFFETRPLLQANQPIENTRVWLGKEKTTPVGVTQNIYITVPAGQAHDLKIVIDTSGALKAPLHKGQNIGVAKIMFNNTILMTQAVVALKNNPKANIFTRMQDRVQLVLEKIFHRT